MVEEKKISNKNDDKPFPYCTKGWNWGNYDLGEEALTFQIANMPGLSIPFSEISNANITNKNEVTLEFHQDDTAKDAYFYLLIKY